MKLVWLLSVPAVALVALFAVRSVPTFAVPAWLRCLRRPDDRRTPISRTLSISRSAGMYCNDKTGGDVFVPTGAPIDPG